MPGRVATGAMSALLAGIAVLGGASPASSHDDTIVFTVEDGRAGRILALATYANDKDPVTDNVVGTMTAQSPDGRRAGPWPLTRVSGTPGGYTTKDALPEGQWRVTVRSAFPELGYGVGSVTIAAPARHSAHRDRPPVPAPASSPRPQADVGGGMQQLGGWLALAAVATVASALLARHRMRNRGR
ncbi:hypothetical protein [Streptomyces sp. NBC_00829]|uniref:hypothetical protein n=1 Tax=Streptomyces sp. NBC_00829 TaxID=2903679 RepID=UPI00386F2549|nr:hypothetical protein OG293_18025 [Streptomyces sp. NBC_00829]